MRRVQIGLRDACTCVISVVSTYGRYIQAILLIERCCVRHSGGRIVASSSCRSSFSYYYYFSCCCLISMHLVFGICVLNASTWCLLVRRDNRQTHTIRSHTYHTTTSRYDDNDDGDDATI